MAAIDPISRFKEWYRAARQAGISLPEAMTLATTSPSGKPRARMVLFKDVSEDGFSFYTNYNSSKARELDKHPYAALVFHWHKLERQIRIEGRVKKLSKAASDAYWKTRPRGSQIGAWASLQSSRIAKPGDLGKRVRETEERFEGKPVPRPPHWGGFLVVPSRIEFWQGRADRLHIRHDYRKAGKRWRVFTLFP